MGKKKLKYSHFCFCLGLRPGVIISSVLWLIEGIVFSTLFVKSSTRNYKSLDGTGEEVIPLLYYYVDALSKVLSIYFIILSIISTYGLASLLIYKSTPLLRMYSYTSWFFAVFINSVLIIVSIIAMTIIRKSYIDYCNRYENRQDCKLFVNSQLVWLFIVLFIQSSLHIYFSIILRTYVKNRVQMEKKKKRSLLKANNLFNIKIDKMFGDRVIDLN
ncbi:hypothetical protein RclHR1_05030016 [Rhizophagus clarus]|uniref:Uncharacterized protein n=1 Tax=Rhizophagus clarus TaxID=94130 RepID=A0A2Z6SE75_9GLOM|nr:hypothetical protein RclHR1_05030016 [Rhizophagus clarus]GES90582.1 hypothetical protein GLOIN_2v1721672 [Rhizophagus clarus]